METYWLFIKSAVYVVSKLYTNKNDLGVEYYREVVWANYSSAVYNYSCFVNLIPMCTRAYNTFIYNLIFQEKGVRIRIILDLSVKHNNK